MNYSIYPIIQLFETREVNKKDYLSEFQTLSTPAFTATMCTCRGGVRAHLTTWLAVSGLGLIGQSVVARALSISRTRGVLNVAWHWAGTRKMLLSKIAIACFDQVSNGNYKGRHQTAYVGPMLGHRPGRWPSIGPTQGRRVLSGDWYHLN